MHARTACLLLAIGALFAQSPLFEVASVKLQPWTGSGGVGVSIHGNTLDAEHVSLRDIVEVAYDLRDVQLSGGPAWADRREAKLNDAELYQVIGKAASEAPPSKDVFRQMLQALLADRFQLKIHHVQKDLPIYNLTADKSGPKLERSAAETKFTEAFRTHQVEEAWVVIWPEHLGSKAFLAGVDETALAADYYSLTGREFPAQPTS